MEEDMNLDDLMQLLHGNDADDADVTNFVTIAEANQIVATHMNRPGYSVVARTVAEFIGHGDRFVTGSADDYHNLIQDYFRMRDFESALMLSERALAVFPYNVDLLANAIRAASYCARFDLCDKYENVARACGTQYWNWRVFVFLIDAYSTRLSVCDPDERGKHLETAHRIADEYLTAFPQDDRAYNAKAQLYLVDNKKDQAVATLNRAIFGDPATGFQPISAPTCCVTFLDLLEPVDEASIDLIIRVAHRGVHNTAEEQPSASIGYFLYREALALDARISSKKDGYTNPDAITEALNCYECAYALLDGRTSYRDTIEKRYTILTKRGPGDYSHRSLA